MRSGSLVAVMAPVAVAAVVSTGLAMVVNLATGAGRGGCGRWWRCRPWPASRRLYGSTSASPPLHLHRLRRRRVRCKRPGRAAWQWDETRAVRSAPATTRHPPHRRPAPQPPRDPAERAPGSGWPPCREGRHRRGIVTSGVGSRVVSARQRRVGAMGGAYLGLSAECQLAMWPWMPSRRNSRPVRKVWSASRWAASRMTVASAGNRPVAKVRSR